MSSRKRMGGQCGGVKPLTAYQQAVWKMLKEEGHIDVTECGDLKSALDTLVHREYAVGGKLKTAEGWVYGYEPNEALPVNLSTGRVNWHNFHGKGHGGFATFQKGELARLAGHNVKGGG